MEQIIKQFMNTIDDKDKEIKRLNEQEISL
jgi:hypothetical protein